MYVKRVLSLNNGWSKLTNEKPQEWQEAIHALELIKAQDIIDGIEQVRRGVARAGTTEIVSRTRATYLAFYLYSLYSRILRQELKWNEVLPQLVEGSNEPIEPRVIKNGVSAAIVGTDTMTGADYVSNLYLEIPYYTSAGYLDVSVIFIPTTEAISHIISLGAEPIEVSKIHTEELCRTQAIRFGSITSKAPVVLAFFSPTAPEEIAVEEAVPLKVDGPTIERTLEFAPEYYQASVVLLSYFGEILRQKDPNTKAKVRIEQEGNTVRLRIESPSGKVETIEEQLEQYALIVNHQAPPESLLDNPGQIIQLKAQLRMAQMQVETAHDLKQLSDGRITSLEKQVEFLQSQFAAQILQNDKIINLAAQQSSSHERIVAALIDHSQGLFKDMLHEASGNQQLTEAVHSLQSNLLSGIAAVDIEDQLDRALSTIKEEKPGFLGRILTEFKGAAYKASASSAVTATITWVQDWIHTH